MLSDRVVPGPCRSITPSLKPGLPLDCPDEAEFMTCGMEVAIMPATARPAEVLIAAMLLASIAAISGAVAGFAASGLPKDEAVASAVAALAFIMT